MSNLPSMHPLEDFSYQATTDSDMVEHLTRDKQTSKDPMLLCCQKFL
jgi:hypothetical protein